MKSRTARQAFICEAVFGCEIKPGEQYVRIKVPSAATPEGYGFAFTQHRYAKVHAYDDECKRHTPVRKLEK